MSKIRTIVMLVACCAAVASAQNGAGASSQAPQNQSQPARPPVIRVSTGVMLGLVEHKTMPVYPDEAMSKGIQGDAIFKLEVDETGKITSSAPIDGDPLLIAASKDALRNFRFRPYMLNGTPTKVQSQLGFHFAVEKTADGVSGHVECMASIPNRP
ncbi:MAG TPA: energy transducer TonB [Terriglobales bacterium]|nr:energy transducer TonB [Terriglobales bacterium]